MHKDAKITSCKKVQISIAVSKAVQEVNRMVLSSNAGCPLSHRPSACLDKAAAGAGRLEAPGWAAEPRSATRRFASRRRWMDTRGRW